MKKTINYFKKSVFVLAIAMISALNLLPASSVQAAQVPYNPNGTRTSTTPVFNIFTNVPNGIDDESNFVKLRKSSGDVTTPATTTPFVDPLSATCAVGEKFDIATYVHNGADPEKNGNGSGTAVAHDVTVAMTAKLGETRRSFPFGSTISASNANSVSDIATLNCASDVQLKLVPSSVRVYSPKPGWVGAPDSAVNGSLRIGSQVAGSGDQWACWDNRITVVYIVEVVKTPETPETPETPKTPPVTVIPSTGAGSMIGGLVGSSATAYGAYALYQKRKALKSLK